MLRRETAYKLAGRKLAAVDETGHSKNLLSRCLSLQFANQRMQALQILECLPDLDAQAHKSNAHLVQIRYCLNTYKLEDIEQYLLGQGVILSQSWGVRLSRAWLRFCEETQQHNLHAPEQRLLKNSNKIYMQAYEHHRHGDHDDTPADLREQK